MNITINGIDIRKALARFGGDESALLSVLNSYTHNTRLLLGKLSAYLAAGDLRAYSITTHGIKGSSNSIYALDIGKAAESLESHAGAGNIDAVTAGHSAFIAQTAAFLNEMGKALDAIAESIDAKKPVAEAPDPALFSELRDACKSYAMDRVDSAIEALEKYRYENPIYRKLVARLRIQVDCMAFMEISETVSPFI